MIIRGGEIFTENGTFKKGNLTIKAGKITEIDFETLDKENNDTINETVLDAQKYYVLPGFVDIHMHGCLGVDFCDASKETFEKMEMYQLENGITTIFPATMTLPESELGRILENASEYVKNSDMNVIAGITMEGPFLSKQKKGAQEEKYIRNAEIAFFERMKEKSDGLIRQVVVAPEEDGSIEFVREVSKEVIVSIGHSKADYETALGAFEEGATHVTHLFNGMSSFLHREPGIVGAALDAKNVFVELICDGVHIHPAMVRAVFQLFGAAKICMISDSLSAVGMRDGEYVLGGQCILKKDNYATLQDGTLAGSVCNLYECFQKTILEMQIPLEEAVLSCTKTPAKSMGVDETYGIIKEGRNADILILDKDLNIKYILKNGDIIIEK